MILHHGQKARVLLLPLLLQLLLSSCATVVQTPPPTIINPTQNFTTLMQEQICLEGSGSGRLKSSAQSGSFEFENQLNQNEQRWIWFFTLPLKGEEVVELRWDQLGVVSSPQLATSAPQLKILLQQLITLLQPRSPQCQLRSSHHYECTLSAKVSADVNWISSNQVEIRQKIDDQQKSSDLLLRATRSDSLAPTFSQYELIFTHLSYSTIFQLQMNECLK